MKTDITILLDKSSSMSILREQTKKSFNSFIREQRSLDEPCTVTLYVFGSEWEKVYEGLDISQVPDLTDENYNIGGMTAYYDAFCNAIDGTGRRLANMSSSKRPDNVIFITLTDGEENVSKQFKKWDVQQRVQHQTDKYKWKFIYLGTNQDAVRVAQELNIPAHHAYTYTNDARGLETMSKNLSYNVTQSRVGNDMNFDRDSEDNSNNLKDALSKLSNGTRSKSA